MTLKPRTYQVLQRAVEEGISYGYRRAHKHLEEGQTPSEQSLKDAIEDAVMLNITEWFHIDDWSED